MMARTAKHGPVYICLGGKIEPGETDVECLVREVREEASVEIDLSSIKYLAEFEAPAYGHEDTILHEKLYIGRLIGDPTPSSEVVALQYVDSNENPDHLTAITREFMFPWLKDHGYIN
jgi:8-oxo-dGTP pyrophosphatase MutT (NUDIX family)